MGPVLGPRLVGVEFEDGHHLSARQDGDADAHLEAGLGHRGGPQRGGVPAASLCPDRPGLRPGAARQPLPRGQGEVLARPGELLRIETGAGDTRHPAQQAGARLGQPGLAHHPAGGVAHQPQPHLQGLVDVGASAAAAVSVRNRRSSWVRFSTIASTPAWRLSNRSCRSAIEPHLGHAPDARVDQEQVLEGHPTGVFQPAPLAAGQPPEDRLRPVEAAQRWSARTTAVAVSSTRQSR